MNRIFSHQLQTRRSAFTLIEMLISVALLLMMISIFGQIFSIATSTIRTQRGIGVNDQKARTLDVIIRGDLGNISYRPIPGEDGITPMIGDFTADPSLAFPLNVNNNQLGFDGAPGKHPNMQGYFYVSENDPDNDTDDVLQFTVQASSQSVPYYLKATTLNAWTEATTGNDHPDMDDAIPENGTSISRQAEIAYFLRNGNLYRRVLGIRAPLFDQPETIPIPVQPTRISPTPAQPLFSADYPAPPTNNFYTDFDFSGRYDTGLGYVHFNLMSDLSNPVSRFGHYLGTPTAMADGTAIIQGFPREYIGSGANRRFIGRYNLEEASALNFGIPQFQPAAGAHPMLRQYNATQLNEFDSSGRIASVYSGRRIGEDILMANVLSFDVKVWDEAVGEFVNLGHGEFDPTLTQYVGTRDVHDDIDGTGDGVADGDYAYFQFDANASGNPLLGTSPDIKDPVIGNMSYGDPHSPVINNNAGSRHFVFDTWGSDVQIGSDVGTGTPSLPSMPPSPAASANNHSWQPPIRTLKYPVYRRGDTNGLPKGEENSVPWTTAYSSLSEVQRVIRRTHAVRWQSGLQIKVGDVVVPSYATVFRSPNATDPNRQEFYHEYIPDSHRDIVAFRAKKVVEYETARDGFLTTVAEPFWTQVGGYRVDYVGGTISTASPVPVNYSPSNPDTITEPTGNGAIIWERILNIQPLKAIKLTIHFRDVGSDQVRQLTIIHSLN